jgi:diguanylate cyclase (GGDEF)-like protein
MTRKAARILVADDDGVALLVAQTALEAAGFEVVIAESGGTAVRLFNECSPDCVILDVMMPGMNGYEACRAIRKTANGTDTPVLILTSRDDVEAVAGAYDSGATDFATKGISTRLLVERVRFLLREYEARRALVVSRSRLRMVQQMARVGQWEVDEAGRTIFVSSLVRSMLPPGDENGGDLAQLAAALRATDGRKMLEAFRGWQGSHTSFRLEAELESGVSLHIQGVTTPGTEASSPTLTLAVQDTTALRRAQRHAYRLSHFDTLTGLPNRRQFLDSLAGQLRGLESGTQLALLVFRVHGLDRLQQSFGQAGSDAALAKAAQLIARIVGDGDRIALAHLGGGEFAYCGSRSSSPATAAGIAEDIAHTLSAPIAGEGWKTSFLVSTGIVVWPTDGDDAESLLENARATAARGASSNESRFDFYSAEVQERARRVLELESAMHGALERGELSLVYQPRIRLDDRAVCGAEALIRWSHPQLGEVQPAEFVPIAEDSGLIVALGSWVLREACRQAAEWRSGSGSGLKVSVNVSPQQLGSPRAFVKDVIDALRIAGLTADGLELELTESMMVSASGELLAALHEIRRLGVSIALDDFGTGFSSLAYLRRLPADCLKIDRSFVVDLADGDDAQRVMQAIVAMADALRLRTVAEGVSTAEQLDVVSRLGCHEGQGFLFARPLGVEAMAAYLSQSGNIAPANTASAA